MELFIYLLIVWAVVTVLGHGSWVLLSRLFGSQRPPPRESPRPFRRACPRCGTLFGLAIDSCAVCGWPSEEGARTDPQAALRSLRLQLAELSRLGALDAETHAALQDAIRAQQQRLEELEPAAATVPAQAAAPLPMSEAAPAEPSEAAAPAVPRTPAPLDERARAYAASRAAAAEEPPPVPPTPPPQREALSRLFAAFIEEKNIRWGELVGGLLIVGCSVALVISFWSEIAARPLLKFVLFNGLTAALFGVGLYTDRRWKIHTTSHGLLVIATLLVPLNFLAIAAFTQASPPTDALSIAGEAVSLVVFSLLVFLAGQIVTPGAAVLLTVGVMVPSLMQLLVRRWADPASSVVEIYALAAVPIVCYLACTVVSIRRRWLESELDEPGAHRLFTLLGVLSAATLLPLALLTFRVPPPAEIIHRLSPLVVWCGVPGLLAGLLFWLRLTDRRLSGVQTAGLAVGVLGAAIMAGAVVAAWPEPATLLPVAVMNVVAFAAVAFWFAIPAAHVPAGLALGGVWLVGFHLLRGNLAWTLPNYEPLADAVLSVASGHALVPLVGLFAALVGLLWRSRRQDDARMIALVAAATAIASLALVVWFGFGRAGDPNGATWTLAIYAIGCLAAAVIVDRAPLAWISSALTLAALWQAVVFRYAAADWAIDRPRVAAALLAHATLAVVGLVVMAGRRRRHVNLGAVLEWSAMISSVAAAAVLAVSATTTSAAAMAVYLAWLAGVWLVLSALAGWPLLFTVSQVAVVLAIFAAVTAMVNARAWYTAAAHPWLDPWFLEAQGIALALYCLARGAARWGFQRITEQRAEYVVDLPPPNWVATGSRLLSPPWPAVDHVIEVALVALVVLIAGYSVLPGVAQELAPLEAARGAGAAVRVVPPVDDFEIAGIVHEHATGGGVWMLGLAVVAVLAAGLARRHAVRPRVAGCVIVLAMICPLLAARWEAEVAVASAWRWLSAGFFCVASIPIWMRERLFSAAPAPLARQARDLLVAITCLVYVAMGAYVAQAAFARAGLAPGTDWLWPYVLGWALVAAAAALLIPWAAESHARDLPGESTVGTRRGGSLQPWARTTRDVLLLVAFAPAAILIAFAVASALDQHPIVGPELTSWFRTIGWDVSYGVPLAVIALVFVGYAIRDRSSRFAFSAGLLANVVATIVVLLRLARGGGGLDAVGWITVAQVNAIVAGGVALIWLAAVRWSHVAESVGDSDARFGERRPREPVLLVTQIALAAALCATFLVPATVAFAVDPDRPTTWTGAAGSTLAWIALALSGLSTAWIHWRQPVPQSVVAAYTAAAVSLIALTVLRSGLGNWLAFHVLLAGVCAAAWLVPLIAQLLNRHVDRADSDLPRIAWSAFSARSFGIVAVLLALYALAEGDPAAPWWTIAALATISARNVWIAWYESRPGFMWIAALLAHVAVSIWWIDSGYRWTGTQDMAQGLEFLWTNALAAAAMAIISLWITLRQREPSQHEAPRRYRVSFHRFAAWAIVAVLLFTIGLGLLADLLGEPLGAYMPLAWATWLAALLVAVGCWWDPASRWPVACVYSVGLLGVGIYLDGLDFRAPMFHWAMANALAAYSLATSYLWNRRSEIRGTLTRLGVPMAAVNDAAAPTVQPTWHAGSGHGWLVSANTLSAVAVLLLVGWIEIIMPDFTHRMIAAYAVGAEALALGLLARGAVRSPLQYTALVFGVLFAVAFGWAWLPPGFAAPWLHRTVAATAALAVMIVLYGIGMVKLLRRENEWTRAAQRLVPLLVVVATGLVLVVLAIEVTAYVNAGSVPIAWTALVTVVIALVGMAAASLVAALVPGRDPLGLSERGRTAYVYAAEAIAALTFLHIRVTMPWLFTGWFLRFWPLVVMAIAFVGVGLGEFFGRWRQHILSEPLQNTGALLPLLPALGFWVTESEVHYSLLLLTAGVLYSAMSVLRKSFAFAVLAAIAANGSLWYLLHTRAGLGLLEHPQLWLIPPALCVLVAGYLNRERLTAAQSAALRYGSAMVIYVSSTADIFINGVADAPWLPAVLAGLSILGVFAGMLLRVRAFLYLGTAFLIVALLTIIWYAAIEQQRTWILWVAGIVTGVAIIALFGLFEKRRDDVLRLVERLKQWEA